MSCPWQLVSPRKVSLRTTASKLRTLTLKFLPITLSLGRRTPTLTHPQINLSIGLDLAIMLLQNQAPTTQSLEKLVKELVASNLPTLDRVQQDYSILLSNTSLPR
ncbi:hypothetical protein EB796_000784 [Bugula neritina]|uniref:Uncharacterized protein n=1 Tax=Bugula neritina TaxID=10212 RepID=A0A7J7KS74_BUGNE|nr:hypothetical protein EB796_000784 [Bugula neritina]